jgi:aspartyl-tRNA(Asn)/glutamyl-tRNA(Gln) amidotransferase subunit A
VAAGLCYGAIGTDTGGSIRIPSSLCGVVGMKPTFGRISKFGIYPLSPSLDHVGALTRSARDNAILLQALCGHDPRDPHSVVHSADIASAYADGDLRGISIGIPSDFFFDNLQVEVRSGIDDALRRLVNLGADVRDVHIPHLADMRRAHQILIAAESFRTHKDMLRDVPEQYDEEVMERLVAGADPISCSPRVFSGVGGR